ncbi:conjugal transfer protein TraF [Alcaligenes faecalis]|uniref:conjugal transfer protein TraF n=1 Tax=Alcaligenes faecalis TaxID=511 RepID=UPI000F6890EF|nr:conjugal transfer protein TraF [Alcaligenes faecalis]RSE57586.1 conjugal transfer protein TraF [Alcaligenes faecalis]
MVEHDDMKPKRHLDYQLNAVKLILCSVTLAILGAACSTDIQAQSFYDRKEEGWFWYKEDPEPEQEQEQEPESEPEQPVVIIAPPTEAPTQEVAPTAPAPLSAAWLRENMMKYLDVAIDEPSPENVKAYLYLQRLAMDKAERYAMVSQRVNVGNPFLDETIRRPSSSFAVTSVDAMAGVARAQLVKKIAANAGIFFFYQSDCSLCTLQAPIIKSLETQEGFSVIPVSVDGENMPNSPWEEFKADNGHAALLGIENLPATYLVGADGSMVSLGQGVYALPELQERIIKVAVVEGWVSEEEANQTRPIRNFNNLADILEAGRVDTQISAKADESGFIPPQEILQHITRQMQ